MVGLIDIAPRTETVDVDGVAVEVRGISAAGVASILARFPEIRMLMSGREVDADRIFAIGGNAVAAIIAAGCGYPGDADAERVAGTLHVEAQADILEVVLRLTLPKGIGPFVEKLTSLGAVVSGEAGRSQKAPATK
jgi:hypothetical protein